jgi:NADH dehydrogenase
MARPRIVIVGGGFGGIAAAQGLAGAPADVLLVDRSNHFVFQPLLYQVASGTLAPSDIAVPIRWYLRRQKNTRVLLGDVTGVDVDARTVTIDGTRSEPYDYLVLAAGSRHAYFGHGEWESRAPGLKTLEDALLMRSRFLRSFEEAEKGEDETIRREWQTILIVGGGPTGVELAGIMITMARKAMRPDFRRIDTAATRIVLVEGGARLLPTFPADLGEAARRDLEAMGVEVRLNTLVTDVTDTSARLGGETLAARTIFWAAGNAASPLSRQLEAPTRPNGQVEVLPDLTIPGHPEVFVVGDIAVVRQENGKPVPGVCQGAMQEGANAAANIRRTMAGRERRPFRYRNKGDMATIGRHRAVADLGFIHVTGILAWYLWLFIHILFLAGFRNRLVVLLEWGWEYLTYEKGVRLILGRAPAER